MTESVSTTGPLTVSTTNPRYFTPLAATPTGRAVYLTGSHIWNNLHDGMGPGADCADRARSGSTTTPTCASSTSAATTSSGCGAGSSSGRRRPAATTTSDMTPQPWRAHRAGHGQGRQAAVRPRPASTPPTSTGCASASIAAGEAGIYVGVMLFDGWALHLSPPPDNIEGHPFHAAQQRQRHRAIQSINDSRCCRSTRASRRSRRRTSARSSTPSTTCPTCSGRSPTSRRATASVTDEFAEFAGPGRARPSGATPPSGSTGSSTSSSGTSGSAATTRIRSG